MIFDFYSCLKLFFQNKILDEHKSIFWLQSATSDNHIEELWVS